MAGASYADIIRTRVSVSDASRWEEAGRAHGEVFSEIRCDHYRRGLGFVAPEILVEIEATAVVD